MSESAIIQSIRWIAANAIRPPGLGDSDVRMFKARVLAK
jgi:hypothetical protein